MITMKIYGSDVRCSKLGSCLSFASIAVDFKGKNFVEIYGKSKAHWTFSSYVTFRYFGKETGKFFNFFFIFGKNLQKCEEFLRNFRKYVGKCNWTNFRTILENSK